MFRTLLFVFGVAALGAAACVMPWLTTLGFIRTEHSSEIGYDGASFWHSGLPLRFLIRSDVSQNVTIHWLSYWFDAVFWFVSLLLLAAFVRFVVRRAQLPSAA